MKVHLFLSFSALVLSQITTKTMQDSYQAQSFNVSNVLYTNLTNLCYGCVFASNVSTYALQSPYCTYTYQGQIWNIAEQFERNQCFNDDPRFYNVTCFTAIANSTFDCPNVCPESLDYNSIRKNRLDTGRTYKIAPDTRCVYWIDFWNPSDTTPILVKASKQSQPNLDIYMTKYPLGANNKTNADRNNIKPNFPFTINKT